MLRKPKNVFVAFGIFAISNCFIYVWMQLALNFWVGGNNWKQGDWLINSVYVPVRRALFGDMIIAISDAMRVSPLLVTILIQAAALLLLAFTLALIITKSQRNPIIILLLASPAFFPFFWAADPQGSMRKEVLVYSSFSLLVFISYYEKFRFFLLLPSVALFVIATLSHEGMIFFAPVYAFFIFLLMDSDKIEKLAAYLSIVAVSTASVVAVILAFSGQSITDYLLVCRPLIERGLDENICGGAIRFLENDVEKNNDIIAGRTSGWKFRNLGIAYALSFGPVAFALWHSNASPRLYAIVIAIGTTFAPLYFLGGDWGRWLNFHFTSVIFLIAIMSSIRKLRFERETKIIYVLPLLVFGLFWGVGHVNPLRQHGLLQEAYRALSHIL